MRVDVYAYYGDMCGNSDQYFYGTYECESVETARRVFREGGICGWRVYESSPVMKLPTYKPELPSEHDMERQKFTPACFESDFRKKMQKTPNPNMKTWDQWKELDLHVKKGEKAKAFNAAGKALFDRAQVTTRVRWYPDEDYGYWGRAPREEYKEEEPKVVYYADGSGYVNYGGPCGPLYFDRNGDT